LTASCWCCLSGSEPPSSETTSWWQVSGVGLRSRPGYCETLWHTVYKTLRTLSMTDWPGESKWKDIIPYWCHLLNQL
jgi:hypothetical protein